jgi:hypothetical protein
VVVVVVVVAVGVEWLWLWSWLWLWLWRWRWWWWWTGWDERYAAATVQDVWKHDAGGGVADNIADAAQGSQRTELFAGVSTLDTGIQLLVFSSGGSCFCRRRLLICTDDHSSGATKHCRCHVKKSCPGCRWNAMRLVVSKASTCAAYALPYLIEYHLSTLFVTEHASQLHGRVADAHGTAQHSAA